MERVSEVETITNILIVSDEQPMIELLRANLLREGYRVVAATDAIAAMKLLKEHRPRLAIFDTKEPISKSAKALATMRPHCSFPIIILITRNGVATLHNILTHEDELFVKPFDINKLLSLVRAKLSKVQDNDIQC